MSKKMSRKLLFVVFSDDACRQNHAFMYALDLHAHGHATKVLLEGTGTKVLAELDQAESRTGALLRRVIDAGLLAGACERAANGCASDDPARRVTTSAAKHGVSLVAGMDGHASIQQYVEAGYEIVAL